MFTNKYLCRDIKLKEGMLFKELLVPKAGSLIIDMKLYQTANLILIILLD